MPLSEPPAPPLSTALRLRIVAAWLAEAWERLWARLWRPASYGAFILALVLMDLLPALPGWLHVLTLVALLAGWAAATTRALTGFRWPTPAAAKARLEQAAATPHRPLTAVQDRLAGDGAGPVSPGQRALWALHQARARSSLDALRARWPSPGVAARDPLTLRAAAVIALVVALAGSWGDIGPRFARAAWPSWDDSSAGPSVKVWITPPDYTGRSPIFVESPPAPGASVPAVLETPERSKLLVVVTGTARATTVAVDDDVTPLEQLADRSQRLERDLPGGKVLEVRQRGRVLGSWRLSALPDLPPSIQFVRPPREAGRGRLRLDYRASDDYGLASVTARVVRPAAAEAAPPDTEESFEFELTVPPFTPSEALQASLHDLTAHPWAGQAVLIQLIAADQAGQRAPSDFAEAVLPERIFQHPVAKEIAALRKGLLNEPERAAGHAFRRISAILQAPAAFGGDPRVVLELATAKYRLAYEGPSAAASLAPILWSAAVRIEDGNLAETEQRLDHAEQALKEAMERGASAEEISRLIDQLKRAIADYARELAARMSDSAVSLLQPDADQRSVGPEDLARLMEEMRQMARMGAQDAARQMLAELQSMLQALRSTATGQTDNPDVKAAQEIMKDLKSLTAEQSKLLDETFKQAREAQLERGADRERRQQQVQRQIAERQEKLRQELGNLMGRMAEAAGQVPESMGEAEGAMREARDALNDGQLMPATDAEAQALAQLQDSLREANQQLMQALAEKGLAGMVPLPDEGESGNDPLGQRNGPDDDAQVEIPDAPDANSMAERVRAILEEIQRRAADRTRPAEEQDYLRRLMKQF